VDTLDLIAFCGSTDEYGLKDRHTAMEHTQTLSLFFNLPS